MYQKGLTKADIYKTLGIGKTKFFAMIKQNNELSELFKNDDELIRAKAKELIMNKPTKQFFVDKVIEIINRDNVRLDEVIKAFKLLYPDEDWYRRNEEERTQIERDRLNQDKGKENVKVIINGSIDYGD